VSKKPSTENLRRARPTPAYSASVVERAPFGLASLPEGVTVMEHRVYGTRLPTATYIYNSVLRMWLRLRRGYHYEGCQGVSLPKLRQDRSH